MCKPLKLTGKLENWLKSEICESNVVHMIMADVVVKKYPDANACLQDNSRSFTCDEQTLD